ncbi:MAG: hypothetical protein IH984_15095 [Planctomycetes bacterium]|nr:hypothetical protein [Planctomycetota bacterium]
MMKITTKIVSALFALMAIFAPVICFAQTVPDPTLRRNSPVWLGYMVMFFLATLVIAVSLLPSKRSHQD